MKHMSIPRTMLAWLMIECDRVTDRQNGI